MRGEEAQGFDECHAHVRCWRASAAVFQSQQLEHVVGEFSRTGGANRLVIECMHPFPRERLDRFERARTQLEKNLPQLSRLMSR